MKSMVIDALAGALPAVPRTEIERLLELPPSEEMGDYAFPCFSLAKTLRKNPAMIAQDLASKLTGAHGISEARPVSGYLNIIVDKLLLARIVLEQVQRDDFGVCGTAGRAVVEYCSPNTNKPLHLGHLRNMSIGESVSRILSFCGKQVVRACIYNDRGVHICKSMLAYLRLGNGTTPEQSGKKPDHLVGDFYVLFSKTAAQDATWNESAQEMLRQWEHGNPDILALWRTMNGWALEGYRETYRLFGIRFDKEYFESEIYKKGKEIVEDGLRRGIFTKREDGAVFVDLEQEKLGEKVLLRPDGTSVYIVQDLYLALLKDEEFHYDTSIYVVGNEQEYHFAVLTAILKKLQLPVADRLHHLSYGMVELPEGKMKSREGTVVDADDLIRETQDLAREELRQRYTLTDQVLEDRSLKIALAAIKYQLLKIDITKNMVFDPKKAISFEGDTGPYLLYSYARASSILRKAGTRDDSVAPSTLSASEIRLIKKIGLFPESLAFASDNLSPSTIATYAFELAQQFNEFYHADQVIGSMEQDFRLRLVQAFRIVLKRCLDLLGISEIEEM